MKNYITPIFVLLFLLISSQGISQDDRTFWQKIFGKKSDQVDVKEPKNSQDSLALLLNNHLGNETNTIEPEDTLDNTYTVDKPVKNSEGSVTLYMDDNITNWLDTVESATITGFRIQVFMGDLTEARSIRSSMLNSGERATLDYNSSDYFVRIGDFRNYISAEKKLNAIRELYPSAYVVKDNIKLK